MSDMNLIKATANFDLYMTDDKFRGYFEHNELGEDCAGGLWFYHNDEGKLSLLDYDGVFELPAEVIATMEELGYDMNHAKDSDEDQDE
jgi:hypothetical protein